MTKTLNRYIFREIAVPFFLGTVTFTGVLLMSRVMKIADLVVAKGVPVTAILRMIGYLVPVFCPVTIPMALLLAYLLAFGRLSGDSEITAMKACGVGLNSLLPPVLTFAFCVYLLTTFITAYALPRANGAFKTFVYEELKAQAAASIDERVFNDDIPGIVIYAENSDLEQRTLSGVLIHDERNPDMPQTIFAERGVISTDPAVQIIHLQLSNGSFHQLRGKSDYRMAEFREYDLAINLVAGNKVVHNEVDMTFAELRHNMASPDLDGKQKRVLQIEFHRRFSLPFACFVFALVGVPLGIQNERSGKGGGFSLSIAVILIYYVILSLGRLLGERGVLHPALAVWLPNIIFLGGGIYLYRMTAREEHLALFDLGHALIVRLRGMFSRRRRRK